MHSTSNIKRRRDSNASTCKEGEPINNLLNVKFSPSIFHPQNTPILITLFYHSQEPLKKRDMMKPNGNEIERERERFIDNMCEPFVKLHPSHLPGCSYSVLFHFLQVKSVMNTLPFPDSRSSRDIRLSHDTSSSHDICLSHNTSHSFNTRLSHKTRLSHNIRHSHSIRHTGKIGVSHDTYPAHGACP